MLALNRNVREPLLEHMTSYSRWQYFSLLPHILRLNLCYWIKSEEKYFVSKISFQYFFSMALPTHSGPKPLIQFRNYFSQTVGLLGRVIRPSQGPYLNSGQHKHRINAYTHQTSMPWVGFEPTIPASERAKIVHALDRKATVTGLISVMYNTYHQYFK
jgi:hypothetical protein